MREEYIGESKPAVLTVMGGEAFKTQRIRYTDWGVEATFMAMPTKEIREGEKSFIPWHRVHAISVLE
jgi:hypothetical protein